MALGALLYPALRADGFSDRSALGLVTTSGSLGLLLVPSVPLILYGVLAQQLGVGPTFTLRQLFLAGVVPLLLMMLALGAVALLQLRRQAGLARRGQRRQCRRRRLARSSRKRSGRRALKRPCRCWS